MTYILIKKTNLNTLFHIIDTISHDWITKSITHHYHILTFLKNEKFERT